METAVTARDDGQRKARFAEIAAEATRTLGSVRIRDSRGLLVGAQWVHPVSDSRRILFVVLRDLLRNHSYSRRGKATGRGA